MGKGSQVDALGPFPGFGGTQKLVRVIPLVAVSRSYLASCPSEKLEVVQHSNGMCRYSDYAPDADGTDPDRIGSEGRICPFPNSLIRHRVK